MLRLFAADMLAALRELRARAMLHRDLKPENVMITESGAIKVGSPHMFTPICIDGCDQPGVRVASDGPVCRPMRAARASTLDMTF